LCPETSEPVTSVTPAVIAAAWGTSRAYVYKLIKKGLDISSVEAATAWREANAVNGIGSKGKVKDGATPSGEPKPENSYSKKKRVRLRTLQDSLLMAITVEELCAAAVIDKATSTASQNFVNSYNKAHQNRVETEAAIIKQQKERGELITAEAAKAEMAKLASSIISLLRSMPKQFAMKVNPSDEILAEMVLSEGIEALIEQIQLTYERVTA
jgi:hypothetical protein